jgi:DNA repair photolyase
MIVNEVRSKTILSDSKIHQYVINPYIGCQHGCSYCYARYIKKFTGHTEPWGHFVDVRTNAPELLQKEILKKKVGRVWVSGLCDAYQPLEKKYLLTRKIIEILLAHQWPVSVQTRSSLVLRDIDLFKGAPGLEVGLSIPTADDGVRRIFEPNTHSIPDRIKTLEVLHNSGIKTFAMIAPLLPGAEPLVSFLAGKADKIIIDKMNYNYAHWIYSKYGLEDKQSESYFRLTGTRLANDCRQMNIPCNLVF